MSRNAPARFHWRAFVTLVDLGNRAKDSWSATGEPPVPHAELLMKELAGRHGKRPHDLVEILAGA